MSASVQWIDVFLFIFNSVHIIERHKPSVFASEYWENCINLLFVYYYYYYYYWTNIISIIINIIHEIWFGCSIDANQSPSQSPTQSQTPSHIQPFALMTRLHKKRVQTAHIQLQIVIKNISLLETNYFNRTLKHFWRRIFQETCIWRL